MLFNTIDFVIFFVAVLVLVTIIKTKKFQLLFILFASYFFFYYTSNYLIVLLIFSTILDFFVGKEIWKAKTKKRKKQILLISLVGNLGLLGFFKYTNFAIEQFNAFGNFIGLGSDIAFLEIVLPIGISFYTFQTLSYTIDIYRGQITPCKSLKEFAVFVAFFPTLVAGPIIRAKDFLPQLREKIETSGGYKLGLFLIKEQNLKFGITLMAIGFFKKMFFSDNISPFVDEIFANPIGLESYSIMLGTIAFGIQVYGDFSGYSDIAIGAAMILGIYVKANFNNPFFAKSPGDFWTRWHISLSTWVRDYLYLPLVFKRRKSALAVFLSLILSMVIIGIWHGSAWNFAIFGLLHGIFMGTHRSLIMKFPSLRTLYFFKTKFGKIFSIIATQYLMFFTFIAFRVRDLDEMSYSMQKYIFFDFQTSGLFEFISTHKFPLALMLLFFILNFITYMKPNTVKKIATLRLHFWTLFLIAVISLIIFFYVGRQEIFIYFQF